MKRRGLSILIAVCMVISLLPITAFAAETYPIAADGSSIEAPTTKWTDIVTTTPTGYVLDNKGNITIYTAEGLAWLASVVNGLNGQTANDLSGKTVTLTKNLDMSAHVWTPIGTEINLMQASFDGQGHTISGLYVNDDTISNVGLLGASTGDIRNVGVIHSYFKGKNMVGSIAGGMVRGDQKMSNCYAAATVEGKVGIGGLSGTGMVVENCYSACTVSGTSAVGGLVGDLYSSIAYSYAKEGGVSGAVDSIGTDKGILVGAPRASEDTTVKGCGTFDDTGKITLANTWRGNPAVDTGEVDSTYVQSGTTVLLDALNAWVEEEKSEQNFFWKEGSGLPVFDKAFAPLYPIAPDGSSIPAPDTKWTDTVTAKPDGYVVDASGNVTISTEEGLAWLISVVNGLNGQTEDSLNGKTVTLAADLDMKDHSWTPIGTESTLMGAAFDGKGHTVSGLYVNDSTADYVGLLGGSAGDIRNLGVIHSYFKGQMYVGSIVSSMAGYLQKMSNCYAAATVEGNDSVGGLAGFGDTLENCYSACTVSGTSKVGGLVGSLYNSITNSYAKAGGVVGATDSIGTDKGILVGKPRTDRELLIKGCGTFDDTGKVTLVNTWSGNPVADTGEVDSTYVTSGTTTLLEALNAWVTDVNSADNFTWKTASGLPVFDAAYVVPHRHCVCGGILSTDYHDTHDASITYEPWDGKAAMEAGKNYYLAGDVTLESTLVLDVSGTINLCLAGHKLALAEGKTGSVIEVKTGVALNIGDCADGTIENSHAVYTWDATTEAIVKEAESPVSRGLITGGNTTYGGAIRNDGTVALYGGTIAGNRASEAGGAVKNDGNFTIYGGEVAHNIAYGIDHNSGNVTLPKGNGGAIYNNNGTLTLLGGFIGWNTAGAGGNNIYNGAIMKLAGKISVGNPVNANRFDNIELSSPLSIIGALTNEEEIGISMVTPGAFTASSTVADASLYADKFVSTDPAYRVEKDGTELALVKNGQVTVVDSEAQTTGEGYYAPGATVSLDAGSKDGYRFAGWKAEGATLADATSAQTTFVMPAGDVTVTATWVRNGGGNVTPPTNTYRLAVTQTEGGKISPDTVIVNEGTSTTFTITANDGYVVKDVLVDGVSVGAVTTYTLENVKESHTITATFEKKDAPVEPEPDVWKNPFMDVSEGDWFYPYVKQMVQKGMMGGISGAEFAPNAEMTRGMLLTILYRMAGSPAVSAKGDAFYASAREWAMQKGISDGTNMEEPITREQLVTMLWRYAGSPAAAKDALENFKDANEITDYAKDAMAWAYEKGIIGGKGEGILDPKAGATCAETAKMLSIFLPLLAK